MITAKMIETMTDLADAPIEGMREGDLVTIVAVRGEYVEVERADGERFVAGGAQIEIAVDTDDATALIDFTLKAANLRFQLADFLDRQMTIEDLRDLGRDVAEGQSLSNQIFTLELLKFLGALSTVTAHKSEV